MDNKRIQQLKIDQIKPYELNNRIHTPEQIKFIADSIQRFGFNQPLVLDEDLIVLVGHGRLEAAKSIGLEKVPCIVIEGLSIEDKQAYRILDNKIQNDSTWNIDNLAAEIESLRDSGFDMGFCDLDQLTEKMGVEVHSPEKEWSGMPSYDSENQEAFRSLHIHFKDQEGVDAFIKLMDQVVTEKTRSLWYPDQGRRSLKDCTVVDES